MYRTSRFARILTAALAAGVALATAGFAQTARKDIVIAGIYKALDQGWFQDTSAAAEKTALRLGAKEYIKLDASMNPDKYMNALETVIARKVDGLIVCIPDQSLSKVTVDKCKAAGIPVLADDDALILDGKKLAPSFELDAFLVGKQMGEWLVDAVKKNGLVKNPPATAFLSLTMLTVNSCVPRSQGYESAWKAGPFAKVAIINADYNGETEKAFNAASATINANPKIKTWFVCAPNDEGAQGAVRALEQRGLDKNAVVVGLGGYLRQGRVQEALQRLQGFGLHRPGDRRRDGGHGHDGEDPEEQGNLRRVQEARRGFRHVSSGSEDGHQGRLPADHGQGGGLSPPGGRPAGLDGLPCGRRSSGAGGGRCGDGRGRLAAVAEEPTRLDDLDHLPRDQLLPGGVGRLQPR